MLVDEESAQAASRSTVCRWAASGTFRLHGARCAKIALISMSQAILFLAAELPEPLSIVARNNRGVHRDGAQEAIERVSRSS